MFSSGFPGSRSGLIRLENYAVGEGRLEVEAGDIETALGESTTDDSADSYPVTGVGASYRTGDSTLHVLIGQSRYFLQPIDVRAQGKSSVALLTHSTSRKTSRIDVGILHVFRPVYAVTDRKKDSDSVVFGTYARNLSRQNEFFAQALVTPEGVAGFRAGIDRTSFRYQVAASIYKFDSALPDLYPLLKPGETGISVAGAARFSERAILSSSVSYALREETSFGRGSSLYGTAVYVQSFGSDRPFLFASYSKSDVVREELTGRIRLVIADRYSFGVRRGSAAHAFDVRAEYIANQVNTPDRAQLLMAYQHVVGPRSVLDASAVLQRENENVGAEAEAALERSAFGAYSVLVGLRGTYLERQNLASGEMALRLGVGRRLLRQGWYGRIEGRIPFSIGLTRPNVDRSSIAAEIGRRVSWNDIAGIRAAIVPLFSPDSFGSIEGTVKIEEMPARNIMILLNGRPVAETDARGHYRLPRVQVGSATVSIDAAALEPGIASETGFSRRVLVVPRSVSRADFVLGRFKTLHAVVFRCSNGVDAPLRGAKLALIGRDFARTYETDLLGGFRDDALPPGIYDLVIDPASVSGVTAEAIPRPRVDLTRDQLGFVVRIACGRDQSSSTRIYEGRMVLCDGGVETPVAGSSVFLLGMASSHRKITAEDGTFRFEGIPPGRYLVLLDDLTLPGVRREEIPRTMVDLSAADVFGAMLRMRCANKAD